MCACIYLYTFRNIYLYATGFSDAICNINKYIQIYSRFSPGGRILSRSRFRADARSLMMYWRRTCLKTELKDAPSSVFRNGSFSHRSVGSTTTRAKHLWADLKKKKTKMWRCRFSTCPSFAEPGVSVGEELFDWTVPRRVELQEHPLQNQCFYSEFENWNRAVTFEVCSPSSVQCKHPSPPAWRTGLRTEWAAPSPLTCEPRAHTHTLRLLLLLLLHRQIISYWRINVVNLEN